MAAPLPIDEVDNILQAAIQDATDHPLRSIKTISNLNQANLVWEGMWNDTPVILRTAKGEHERSVCKKEVWCLEQASSVGFETATVLSLGKCR